MKRERRARDEKFKFNICLFWKIFTSLLSSIAHLAPTLAMLILMLILILIVILILILILIVILILILITIIWSTLCWLISSCVLLGVLVTSHLALTLAIQSFPYHHLHCHPHPHPYYHIYIWFTLCWLISSCVLLSVRVSSVKHVYDNNNVNSYPTVDRVIINAGHSAKSILIGYGIQYGTLCAG